jgi:hypothetical protein
MKTNEVFVSGGLPSITYNPRKSLKLEDILIDSLETGHKLISVTGPTKCGKTVLCNKVIPLESCVYVEGGSINSEKDFWEFILMDLQVDLETSSTSTETRSNEKSGEISGSIGKFIATLGSKVSEKDSKTKVQSSTSTKITHLKTLAINTLLERNVVLLIDDFHYMEKVLQEGIIRSLKQPIFKGLHVVILAVPHRATDAIKAESEMTGRVTQISIPLWGIDELKEIATLGFDKLNVNCSPIIISQLATESYGSPHLMQEFCSRICKLNGIEESRSEVQNITAPNYTTFFQGIIDSIASKIAFQKLAKGPKIKGQERVQHELLSGEKADIYKVTLMAIAETGPKIEISYDELRASVRKVLKTEPPKRHQITRVLGEMHKIAKGMPSEPVLDWGHEDDPTLYISDPFFAFYLKWSLK